MGGTTEKVLVLCKAIPEESKKYLQVVCVAGINEGSEFRRLYPVPYDQFVQGGGIPFQKKQWITATLHPPADGRDKRPESRKIDLKTLKVLRKAEDREVRSIIKPLSSLNIGAIRAQGASLGLIKPKIHDYELHNMSTQVKAEQLIIGDDGTVQRKNLVKFKQESLYEFVCRDRSGCSCVKRPHRMGVHDWELNEYYGQLIQKTQDVNRIQAEMRSKWFDWIKNDVDTYFLVGTHHRWKIWMIVSVLYLGRS